MSKHLMSKHLMSEDTVLFFTGEAEGPLDLGSNMVALVEVYDEESRLWTPRDEQGNPLRVRVVAQDSDWEGAFLIIGNKGAGKCELAPLMGTDTVYRFSILDGDGMCISDLVDCDLGLPFVDSPLDMPDGPQHHKSFYVRFYAGLALPEPPEPPTGEYLYGSVDGPLCDDTFTAHLFVEDAAGERVTIEGLSIMAWKAVRSGAIFVGVAGEKPEQGPGAYEIGPLWGQLQDWRHGEYPIGLFIFQPWLNNKPCGDAVVVDLSVPFADEAASHACLPQDAGTNSRRHHRMSFDITFSPVPGPPTHVPDCADCARKDALLQVIAALFGDMLTSLGEVISALASIKNAVEAELSGIRLAE